MRSRLAILLFSILACVALLGCLPYKAEQIPPQAVGSPTLNIIPQEYGRDYRDYDPSGAVRIYCRVSDINESDMVARPGQPTGGHLHTFFGNTAVDHNSTSQSVATTGNSTCDGGIANRSIYWAPTMLYPDSDHVPGEDYFNINAHFEGNTGPPSYLPANGLTGNTATNLYYKNGYRGVTAGQVDQWHPPGLKMLAGNPAGDAAGETHPRVGYACVPQGNQASVTGQPTIPFCPITNLAGQGMMVIMLIEFPQCWDGLNLDSVDHGAANSPASHMRYADDWNADGVHDQTQPSVFPTTGGGGWPDRGCPNGSAESTGRTSSGPEWVALPQLTMLIHYPMSAANFPSDDWWLSSDGYAIGNPEDVGGGYSGHADFVSGWDPVIGARLLNHCFRNPPPGAPADAGWDCHGPLLGPNPTTGVLEMLSGNSS